jgi:AcrR family transcriptional regulator
MDVREALLEAAIKVYGEAGMRGATTRLIAEAANVNEVTLFRHFRTKGELMEAALLHVTSRTVGGPLPEHPVDPRAELIAWCRESLASFKCPKSVDVLEALPRNPTGKILKRDLRRPYWEGHDRSTV